MRPGVNECKLLTKNYTNHSCLKSTKMVGINFQLTKAVKKDDLLLPTFIFFCSCPLLRSHITSPLFECINFFSINNKI